MKLFVKLFVKVVRGRLKTFEGISRRFKAFEGVLRLRHEDSGERPAGRASNARTPKERRNTPNEPPECDIGTT